MQLNEKYQKARSRRAQWEGLWQDCYDHALPMRMDTQSTKTTSKLYDATALDAVDQLAASLLGNLTPPWSRWFGLKPGPDLTAAQAEKLAPSLEKATQKMLYHFDRSNFAVEIHQCFLDLVVGGTASLHFEEAALINSYTELEKKMSRSLPMPENDDARKKILKSLGYPDTADEYEIDTSHGLFEADKDMNFKLHEKGFTADQVQTVYDLAAEKLVPLIMEMSASFDAERELDKLIDHFGGEEQWQEISRQLLSYGQANLKPDVLKSLSSSYEGVLTLHKMMKADNTDNVGNVREEMNDLLSNDEQELRSMMKDPKYWKSKDPSFVSKVTKGFEKIYS